ncbi:aminotransferase class V-fold PLP-dependent enzyme [Bacillus sp. DX1.1]|uniref:aminotransferase class V-fold PLP-dependent enzyme n=1 Tax=unclassified Bacillus (in: firmicutes) TaxID=185979 RepID=UPI00256FF306|nr:MULTISPECIES: aminotransferase class V-fold PLP-dependent enzyme [unclassified Bacillus (in: firmicutes)]MDM5154959.1 aminotransferase class V-fold PLP-dependent enzyme [Bacillus sp. DX1.1]WJE83823.1 aminotransferase class V-fold PLP-dependent enzyme [Bacillus sp. DX3.1]
MGLIYKVADQAWEFESIHKLNYKTFVEEIPQHEQTEERIRIDAFHEQNTYLICLDDDKLAGMVAVRGQRPFSLDNKISNLNACLPEHGDTIYEIRLLAVEQEYRNGRALLGLVRFLHRYLLLNGYDMAIISGTTRQLSVYEQMGFRPFYQLVGTEEAAYQPMYLTPALFQQSRIASIVTKEYTFLPGPVEIAANVHQAFCSNPISHRSNQFKVTLTNVKKRLLQMTKAKHVQIMLGTGTLANDSIALQLSLLKGRGLILTNGEFGNRLVQHGIRAGLSFDTYEREMGSPFLYDEIEELLTNQTYEWLWFVHHETSTGMLNDMEKIVRLCKQYHIKLCVDCISSIGACPIYLQDVYFASGVSGKAIGAYTGLSFVFYNHTIEPNEKLPRYMDIGMYELNESVPYSQSWNLMRALQEALKKFADDRVYEKVCETHSFIEKAIIKMGLQIVTPKEHASSIIITIALHKELCSKHIGDTLALQGFILHYESTYLQKNNWIQIACINHYKEREMNSMLNCLRMYAESVHAY